MAFPSPIYLDGHATTPLAPEAEEAMAPFWRFGAANVNSPHAAGVRIAAAVEHARGRVATLIGAAASEVVFTSGATEANNIALLGIAKTAAAQGLTRRRIVVSAIEHKSVLAAAGELTRLGFEIVKLPVNHDGVVDLGAARTLITTHTLLVSVMLANNETGVIQPVRAISEIAHDVGAVMHTDATQAAGKIPIDVVDLDVDLASLSAHKMYGPVGVGALFVSAATPLRPSAIGFGGGQEGGLRPGTVPGPLVVGFGAAAEQCALRLKDDAIHASRLAGQLLEGLRQRQVRLTQHAPAAQRLPGSLCIAFHDMEADQMISSLSTDIYLSSGSACSSGQIEPSHVLQAMQLPASDIMNTVRLYCGRYNTDREMDATASAIADAIRRQPLPTGRTLQ